tara:strand:+ start:512 stop:1291 length:780 start_codon:yes stop_codon:yes gene_type:complete
MAWEWLEKYLKGTSGMPGSRVGEPYEKYIPDTQGLFGTGGNFGKGGLLTTFNQNPNAGNNMFEMLSNPAVGIGASIFTKGMKGEDIGTAAFPSIKEGISFSESISKIDSSRKKRKLIKEYGDKVPEEDKELFLIAPEKYIAAKLTNRMKGQTLSKEALALYQQGKAAGDNFDQWFEGLNKAEKDLYNKQIKPNINALQASFEYIEKTTKKILENAPKVPIVNGAIDINSLQEGIIYNYNNQAFVYDGEKFIPYAKYINQ